MKLSHAMVGFALLVILSQALPNPCVLPCKTGTKCYLGKCVTVELLPVSCAVDQDCSATQTCVGGICVESQTSATCSPTCKLSQTCMNGKCVTTPIKLCNKLCIIGFHCVNGECVQIDKCSNVLCPADKICRNGICIVNPVKVCNRPCMRGTKCVNGQCVPVDPICAAIFCPYGTTCKNGECVTNISVCPTNALYQAKVCTNPRPNDVTCPPVYYIRAPDPRFCGVQADGTRINFAQQCTACKDNSIVYYFNRPCHLVPFVCEAGDTCLDYYCTSTCQNNEECPYDWQICNQNKCIDRCATMRCANGPCKFGQCAYEQASGSCTLGSVSGCKKSDWTCVGFQCADLCVRQACQPYEQCNQGICEPIA